MSGGGATAAMVVVIAAKKREEIYHRFREREAVSAATALSLEELGLPQGGMIRMQVSKGAVVEADGSQYYMDEEIVARQQQLRQWVILALMGILAVVLLVVWLSN